MSTLLNSAPSHDVVLQGCAYLGGCNYPLAAGDLATLSFGSNELSVRLANGASFSVSYFEIASIEISGAGTTTTGGGFIGGGFGVAGALEGMAIATVLNALTTKSKIHTFVSLTTNIGELHMHFGGMEPGALRIALAPIHTTLRKLNPAWRQERLAALQFARVQGSVSELEFERLNERLSQPTREAGVPPPINPKNRQPPPVTGPAGRCPNCSATVSLRAEECFSCKAMFGPNSAWKVIPV